MPINQLVNSCNAHYSRPKVCSKCKHECPGSCDQCLKTIHFTSGVERRYDCPNISLYYVCKYIYRYSSEITYLMRNIDFDGIDKFKILSIGCGPCTDLFGVLNHMIEKKDFKDIYYVGVELNEIWKTIHGTIKDILDEFGFPAKLYFYYNDIFDVFETIKTKPNLLFFQYLLSDMVSYGYDVEDFLKKVVHNIFIKMPEPSYLIVNDINLNKRGRDYFDVLASDIQKIHENVRITKFHFKNNQRWFYTYGILHPENEILTPIPGEIITKFDPWDFCASAQLLIEKRGLR